MVKNKSSFFSWMYETIENTSEIILTADDSWWFGRYAPDIRKWNLPDKKYNVEKYQNYGSYTPTLIDASIDYPVFTHAFNPTNCWWMHAYLGDPTDAAPDTMEYLARGSYPKSISVRNEINGGTHPFIKSMVGCKIVELFGRCGLDMPQTIQPTFAWHKFENENTASYAHLTTVPDFPGDIDTVYQGLECKRDHGGAPSVIDEITRAEWKSTRKFQVLKSNDGLTQNVYLYSYNDIDLTLYGVFEQGQESDDYISRAVQDIALKCFKPDATKYNEIIFKNCHHLGRAATGVAYDGAYEEVMSFKAEKFDFNFIAEGVGVDAFVVQYP